MKIRKLFCTVLLVFSILLAGCGSGQGAQEATPTPYPTPVRPTFTVQRGDIVYSAELPGRVLPLALHTVFFQMSGHVSEVYAQSNDVVKEGQLLAELAEIKDLQEQANTTRGIIRRAEINLETARLLLEKLKAEGRPSYDIKIQELQVELAQMDRDETLAKIGLDPAAATDVLETLNLDLAKAKVFAPADGLIISAVESGRGVSPSTVAFVIGDPNQLEVVSVIDSSPAGEDQLKEMFEGMPVVVTPDARPDLQLKGQIRQLPSPYGTGSSDDRSIHVVLDQLPSPETYQSGEKVTLNVTLANKLGVLWLPPDAIRQAGGRTFVIIDSGAGPQRLEVEIGLQTSDQIEIVSGLDEGQVVIGP